ERFGTQIETVKASKVDFSERPFKIWVGDPDAAAPTYLAHTVIVSTGATALMLNVPGEARLLGHGVSTCATCDGFFFRDHDIAVIGGGDSAVEEASFLSRFAKSVTIVHRRDELRASKIMIDRAEANPKIKFLWNTVVEEAIGEQTLEKLRVKNTLTNDVTDLAVTGMFVAIGHRPTTDIFAGQLDLKDNGYLITQAPSARTSVEGVFACGDVQDDVYRQAITAAGSGCTAALDAERWLEAEGLGH
ncbi:UNVERIFIED_CONTAM: hypothetical protein GTU68_058005, partial [Idotea baltica]|nr:hypothetical protein [Idotea baltica]